MVLEDMFVHEMLMMMEKRSSRNLPTMGVGVVNSRLILYYNPDFVDKLSDAELRYIVTHEIYHVAFHHVTHRLPEDENERGLWNKAADLAINSLIPEDANRHMPKDKKLKGLLPKDFGFEEKLSMEQYVQLLRDKGDDGQGGNGGTYGMPMAGEGEGDEEKDPKQGGGFDSHGEWKESEIVKEIVRGKIEQLARKERAWGSMPGDVKAMILAAQRSQVNWVKYLRRYLGNLISARYESTFKRPNRRFGYPYCGKKRLCIDRKLVTIDTSGSVGNEELAQFLAEVNKLSEIQPVDLQLFDHQLQGKTVPFDKKHIRFDFKDRGGTCFEPVMELASKKRYQSLIILTDGEAGAPEYPRGVKDVLWVIVGGGEPPVKWGKVVKIVPKGTQG